MRFRALIVILLTALQLLKSDGALDLTILHTNDVHARYDEINEYGSRCPEGSKACFGGVARMMTKVREIRKNRKNVIFLNAGDYYQGSLYYSIHKWKISQDFMNRLGYDAMAIGNHEFDDGIQGLAPFLNAVNFPVLACNIDSSKESSFEGKLRPSTEMVVEGQRIGIIGYTTQETPKIAKVGNLVFSEEIPCIQEEVNKMKASGISIIIALGHSGFQVDKDIAKTVKGLDIVIGGHTNTFTYTGTPPSIEEPVAPYPLIVTQSDGSKVLVLEDFAFGKYLGNLSVQFDADGQVQSWSGNPILLDSTIQQDSETVKALEPYKATVKARGQEVVGQTLVDLIGDRKVCRMRECNLGNMLTDAMVWYNQGKPSPDRWSNLTMAVWNGGGIRSSIITNNGEETNITIEDILTVAPFGNTIDIVDLYGKDLRSMMEHSVAEYDPTGINSQGSFLQVSGIKVKYDIRKNVGSRVSELLVKCSRCRVPTYDAVEDKVVYSLAIPTYLIEGGNGFSLKKHAIEVHTRGALDADILINYLKKMSPVSSGLERRIEFITDEDKCGGSEKLSFNLELTLATALIPTCARLFQTLMLHV